MCQHWGSVPNFEVRSQWNLLVVQAQILTQNSPSGILQKNEFLYPHQRCGRPIRHSFDVQESTLSKSHHVYRKISFGRAAQSCNLPWWFDISGKITNRFDSRSQNNRISADCWHWPTVNGKPHLKIRISWLRLVQIGVAAGARSFGR